MKQARSRRELGAARVAVQETPDNHQAPDGIAFRPGETVAIDLLVLNEFSLMSLAATIEPLRAANRASSKQLYRSRLFSWDGRPPTSSSGVSLAIDGAFEPEAERDVLFVVAAFNARRISRSQAADLRKAARRCLAVGGVEAGAWGLGRAGLLDQCTATTHWEDLDEFAAAFPKVNVVNERFIMDRTRWTAGGAAPTLDMMLSLIRYQHGLSLAIDVANIFIYDQKEAGSAPQSVVSEPENPLSEHIPTPPAAETFSLLLLSLHARTA